MLNKKNMKKSDKKQYDALTKKEKVKEDIEWYEPEECECKEELETDGFEYTKDFT